MDATRRWDERYAAAQGGLFGETPSEYLRMTVARGDFAARSALMLADGDGRNGTWLAARGLAVTAVDVSTVATARAEARDRAAGVRARRIAADLAGWRPEPGEGWDLVALMHLHGPRALRRAALERAVAALAPGGWFLMEGFDVAQAEGAIGPDDPDRLWRMDDIRAMIASLELVEALSGPARLDEGPRHRGVAHILRVCARRPA
jgi:SAM-dependent methyltransferase